MIVLLTAFYSASDRMPFSSISISDLIKSGLFEQLRNLLY